MFQFIVNISTSEQHTFRITLSPPLSPQWGLASYPTCPWAAQPVPGRPPTLPMLSYCNKEWVNSWYLSYCIWYLSGTHYLSLTVLGILLKPMISFSPYLVSYWNTLSISHHTGYFTGTHDLNLTALGILLEHKISLLLYWLSNWKTWSLSYRIG